MITLFILLKMSFAGNTQIIDTICIPFSQAQKVMVDAKQKPILLERISLLSTDISLLNQQILGKENIIAVLIKQETKDSSTIAKLEKQKEIMQEQRVVFEKALTLAEKNLRKQKRKTKTIAFIGLFASAGAFFIGVSN